jgi:hypothetical protein
MGCRIDRDALHEFVSRQVELIEATAIPKLLADVVELRLRHEAVGVDPAVRENAFGPPCYSPQSTGQWLPSPPSRERRR